MTETRDYTLILNFDYDYVVSDLKNANISCDDNDFTEIENYNFYNISTD